MRWKISHHGHDPRLNDLLAILALVILIVTAWHGKFSVRAPNHPAKRPSSYRAKAYAGEESGRPNARRRSRLSAAAKNSTVAAAVCPPAVAARAGAAVPVAPPSTPWRR